MIKTVILAAGMARRLKPLTDQTPKCLLHVAGRTLLDRTLDAIRIAGLSDVVVVTGFEAQQIIDHCHHYHCDLRFTWIHNPVFDSTNNIYSLWLTRETLQGHSLLLLDSDILFHPDIISILLNSTNEDCLALRVSQKLGEEEIKVTVNSQGFVEEISKTVDPCAAIGESLGIELFGEELTQILFNKLEDFVVTQKRENDFYEAAFEAVIDDGACISPVSVGNLPCMEIDTVSDLDAAQKLAQYLE